MQSTIVPNLLRKFPLVLAAAALTGLAACGSTTQSGGMPGMDHGNSPMQTAQPSGSASTGTFNNADIMFAQMMIPHHEQAVEMSDIMLAKTGLDPEVTKLAEQIKAAQAPEIKQMTDWLTSWGVGSSAPMDHDMGGGMLSKEQLDALKKATGEDASKQFLTGMIAHHEGAITMAKQEVAAGANEDAKKLAQTIIDTQQAEIDTMKKLLAG